MPFSQIPEFMHPKRVQLPPNTQGRDFVVGDIHFKMSELYQGLAALGFDKAVDRLIGVGDLIDRGPGVLEGLKLLGEPWFHAVQGNHEHMLITAWLTHPNEAYSAHGARWWLSIAEESKAMIIGKLQSLPYVIEIECAAGTVGVLHGDVPRGMSWQGFVGALDKPHVAEATLWGRTRIRKHECHGVSGVWRVCVGHTRVDRPLRLGNVLALDSTGGGEGPLAFFCVQDDAIYVEGRRIQG